jgi:hypothetical protein
VVLLEKSEGEERIESKACSQEMCQTLII